MVGLHAPSPPKIWIANTREGSVYKIRAQLYKIVQNVYEIIASFLFWNFKMVGLGAWISGAERFEISIGRSIEFQWSECYILEWTVFLINTI